ncbi:hypothetical protein L249_7577 [Ophiocordyceps polyrhachis-furcata BCC 54312]|uniref:BolA protein n=1 Tax=Ophiocordyceps polyrhachis-furcata BCC 54312 TaxID=1330021 RepID=A0A367LB31_9HYPO|nr:hypothetical protein L249_7577 [Ophiocordyceps polyrhachis-furcata BCC 54312]
MPLSDTALHAIITQRLEAIHVKVTDTSGGCGQAFDAHIISNLFNGLSSLKRHRRVNAALKDEIAAIHAWSAKCQTPDEWERDKAAAAAAAATDDDATAAAGTA